MAQNNLDILWKRTLDILRSELNRPSFDTWLKSTRLLNINNNLLTIAVPNEFAQDWLESRYSNLIKNTVSLILNKKNIQLRFVLPSEEETSKLFFNEFNQEEEPSTGWEQYPTTQLNPKYTFDSFVIGDSNRFAHAASLAVAEAPAKSYNPLFVYGGVGLGKTHLMHAIGHYVLEELPQYRVVYVSSERFTNELINSIRDDKTEDFRNKYRNVDVLLIDDIQFLAGKERTQEEFFHTFNTLHESNKQIIISSDRPPKEIPTLEHRLRSRFEWGLITDIQPPDLETRIAILKKKTKQQNISLPDEVLNFIADKIRTNIRELEGALIRVAAYASLNNKEIDTELVKEILKDLTAAQSQPITIQLIQKQVAKHFGLHVEEFKDKRRTRSIAFPRQIAMYLCRELTDSSLPKIGEEFGGRDHSTVIHACEKIARQYKEDSNFSKIVDDLVASIKNQ